MFYLSPVIFLLFLSAMLVISSLSLVVGKSGKKLTAVLNILITSIIAFYCFYMEEISFYEVLFLNANKLRHIFVFSLLNLGLIILNGFENYRNIAGSLLNTMLLFLSFALLGAVDFLTFFIVAAFSLLLFPALLAVNKEMKDVSLSLFITNSCVLLVFFMGVVLFFLSTGTLNYYEATIENATLYKVFLSLMFVTGMFMLGVYPFSMYGSDNITGAENKFFSSNIVFSWSMVGYSFISLMFGSWRFSAIFRFNELAEICNWIVFLAILVPGFLSLKTRKIKKVILYAFMSHAGYVYYFINLSQAPGTDGILIRYFFYHSISFVLVLIILNSLKHEGSVVKSIEQARGLAYQNKLLGFGATVSLASIAGVPLLAGGISKYALLSEYFKQGHLTVVAVILASMLLVCMGLVRSFMPLYLPAEKNQNYTVSLKQKELFIIVVIIILMFYGGVKPFLTS